MSGADLQGSVGILPVGALGVGFYFHLTRQLEDLDRPVFFVERSGSTSSQALLEAGSLAITTPAGVRHIPANVCRPPLPDCARANTLPEVLLVCPQSDQILQVVSEYVRVLEFLHQRGGIESAIQQLPTLVLSSNGIYYQRVRRFLVEALEDSTLYGRLPDLWSEPMGQIVGKLLRGVTMQTGRREGQGASAVYFPGPSGVTRLAGGDATHRLRAGEALRNLGGHFEVAEADSPTRVEFDKGLVNLMANLLGQLKAVDAEGRFRPLKVKEILGEREDPETQNLVEHVIAVGRTVRAYRPEETFAVLNEAAVKLAHRAWEHVPSSLSWIGAHLEAGTLKAEITPTEKWLIEPLIQYASMAGLEESVRYFKQLTRRVEERLAAAIRYKRGA
jgi:hypothetical protein